MAKPRPSKNDLAWLRLADRYVAAAVKAEQAAHAKHARPEANRASRARRSQRAEPGGDEPAAKSKALPPSAPDQP